LHEYSEFSGLDFLTFQNEPTPITPEG